MNSPDCTRLRASAWTASLRSPTRAWRTAIASAPVEPARALAAALAQAQLGLQLGGALGPVLALLARASVAARSSLDSVIAGMLRTSATATAASRIAPPKAAGLRRARRDLADEEARDLEQAGERLVAILAARVHPRHFTSDP